MASVDELINLALSKVGYAYSQGPTRTTGQNGYFDCSGFTYFLLQHLGVRPNDWQPQSHLQALYCRDHGSLTTIQQAINTKGALLFEGPDNAYIGGAGIPGHVAVSLGNGHTVEAMGRAWGTCIGGAYGRGWSNAGYFPGIAYPGTQPTNHPPEVTGLQLSEESMSGMPTVIPAGSKVAPNGRVPVISLDVQSGHIFAYNGARIVWRMDPHSPFQTPVIGFGGAIYRIPISAPHQGLALINGVLVVTAQDGGCALADVHLP